jgi:hypothetical protein
MITVSITPSDDGLAALISALEQVSTRKLPNTTRAIKVAVSTLAYTWKAYAMGATIPGTSIKITKVSGAYAKSIKTTNTGLGGTIYSDSPYAASIEEGTEEKDLKKIIPFGPKARMGKNGPYAIIGLRHGIPGSLQAPMPNVVYQAIRQKIKEGEFKKSKVTGSYQTQSQGLNAPPTVISRKTYKWGSRAKIPTFPNLDGMVAFNIPSGKGENRTGYVTFRVITANKPKIDKSAKGWENSWVVPARRGLHLTRYVVANTKDILGEIVRAGMTMDLFP